jgi:hypothetical protein
MVRIRNHFQVQYGSQNIGILQKNIDINQQKLTIDGYLGGKRCMSHSMNNDGNNCRETGSQNCANPPQKITDARKSNAHAA